MITLDTNKYLICSLFNITPARMSEYTDKSLDEIMDIEAQNGNTKAAGFDKEILNDPNELAQIFQLSDENNRFAILQNLTQNELQELLPNLEKSDLQVGLNYFTKDKLLNLLQEVPISDLVKYTGQMFSSEQMMQMMPEEEIDKVFLSPDMDRDALLSNMQTLKPGMLVQMYEEATGQEAPVQKSEGGVSGQQTIYTSNHDIVNMIAALPREKFSDSVLAMSPTAKRGIMLNMAANDNKIMTLFSAKSYINMVALKQKPEMVKAASVLTPEELIKMDNHLPQILLANLVTQINPNKFANILTSQYKNVLQKIVAG